MDKSTFPSDASDKFVVRLPDGMRDEIAAAAKAAGRSMNAEIVHRLDASFASQRSRTHLLKIEDNEGAAWVAELYNTYNRLTPEDGKRLQTIAQLAVAVEGIREQVQSLLDNFNYPGAVKRAEAERTEQAIEPAVAKIIRRKRPEPKAVETKGPVRRKK